MTSIAVLAGELITTEQFQEIPVRVISTKKDRVIPLNDIAIGIGYDKAGLRKIVVRNEKQFAPYICKVVTTSQSVHGDQAREYRKPDQIIQPWQFGHGETKATCLWLKNLPKLIPTDIVKGRIGRVHYCSPGPQRWRERSRTYPGIAAAMADQWGTL